MKTLKTQHSNLSFPAGKMSKDVSTFRFTSKFLSITLCLFSLVLYPTSNLNAQWTSPSTVTQQTTISDDVLIGGSSLNGIGIKCFWDYGKRAFRGGYVATTKWDNQYLGLYSFGFGYDVMASGSFAIAMGQGTIANGSSGATAIGFTTIANGDDGATALGYNTTASGDRGATAMGRSTIASGDNGATALGCNTTASGNVGATALGDHTKASGADGATALGYSTTANGYSGATALGNNTEASGDYGATAIGRKTIANGDRGATALGYYTTASGDDGATALGDHTTASGDFGATALGYYTTASGSLGATAIGADVSADTTTAITIGQGLINYPFTEFSNNVPNSLMMGFNSDMATFFIGQANGTGTTGKVGIGTTNPTHDLHVAGDIAVAGQIVHPSDFNLKENIQNITNGLSMINQLSPKSYTHKTNEAEEFGLSTKPQFGLIAQEVEEVLPEIVIQKALVGEDGEIYMGLDYEKLIPILVAALQEEHEQKEALKTQVESQNQTIQNHQSQVSRLMSQVQMLETNNQEQTTINQTQAAINKQLLDFMESQQSAK